MENLLEVAPSQLAFNDPVRAPMSNSKIVSIKPTTGTSVGTASTGATSTDSITFKLPNVGVLKCASMYVKYDIAVVVADGGSGGIAAVGGVLDEFAPDASCFSRMKVYASDGSQISDQPNYGTWCSINNRLKKSRGELDSRGSVLNGCGSNDADNFQNTTLNMDDYQFNHLASDQTPTADIAANVLNIQRPAGYERNRRILHSQFGKNGFGGVSTVPCGLVHQIQGGLLDAETGHYLPTMSLGSGMSLQFDMADATQCVKVIGSNAAGVQGGTALINASPTVNYHLTNIELICEIAYYDNAVLSSINNQLCQGIKLRHPRVKSQVNSITSANSTVQLSEHGRSINYAIFGLRNTLLTSTYQNFSNDFMYKPNSASYPKNFQCQVGSDVVPAQPVKIDAQSYMELERALSGGNSKFRLGNCVNAASYYKDKLGSADTAGANEVVSGDCLFGVSFMSHGDKPSLMSGKSSSAGSIPLSLSLEMSGGSTSTELMSFIVSDQITELLHDGSVVISR